MRLGLYVCVALVGCGTRAEMVADAGGIESSVDAPPAPNRLEEARAAAEGAANADPRCDDIASKGNPDGFYWEIGDASSVLASGSRGSYSFDTVKSVASATKVVTAAYMLERLAADEQTTRRLNFTSGYVVPEQICPPNTTVQTCFDKLGGEAIYDPTKVGRFYYGPAHMQKLGVSLPDLAPLDSAGLAAEYAKVLGLKTPLSFVYPALASGIEAGPKLFREFLQNLVGGKYKLRALLGTSPQCTSGCGGETSSPIGEPWHYGLGHWIEDGAVEGLADGAFIGLGATGFYIWIDRSKHYYGILGRWASPLGGGGPVPAPSAFCGQKIRAAFLDTLRRSSLRCGEQDQRCDASAVCCDGTCASSCP